MLDVLEIKQTGVLEAEQRASFENDRRRQIRVGVGEKGAEDRVRRRQVIGCGHA